MRAEALRRTQARARRSVDQRNSLSTWTVSRPSGGETDAETGDWAPDDEVVWSGPGHFADASRPFVRQRRDTALVVQGPTFCVTADAPRFRVGDVVAAVRVDDESLMGRAWRIVGEPGSSYAIHRHYPLEEVTDAR